MQVPLDAHFEIKWYAEKRIYYEFDIQERSVSVVDCLTWDWGCGSEPHRRHCIVVFEQYTFILA